MVLKGSERWCPEGCGKSIEYAKTVVRYDDECRAEETISFYQCVRCEKVFTCEDGKLTTNHTVTQEERLRATGEYWDAVRSLRRHGMSDEQIRTILEKTDGERCTEQELYMMHKLGWDLDKVREVLADCKIMGLVEEVLSKKETK